MTDESNLIITEPEMVILQIEKEAAFAFRKRRHLDWRDNYTLYRDKIIPNRLTQRQTVNIPLMKYALGTIMKDIDEAPALYFKNLDNNEQKEVFYNEYWKEMSVRNKMIIQDIIDKKQALLYGRTFKKLNIENGQFTFEIIDPQDILVDRYIDPSDLDSTRVLIQTDIYRTLSQILENDDYKSKGQDKLRLYYTESDAQLEQDDTLNKIQEKNARMQDMGLEDALDPEVGETYIELNEIYRKEYDEEKGEEIYYLYTVAVPGGQMIELQKERLCDVIGETEDNFWYNHLPFNSWATDPERTDFWSDSPADILRGSNQVLNSWYSQLIENRTLRNFNMHYYDSSDPNFVPQTYDPVPWGWYPIPGKPSDVLQTVEVPDLSDSLDEMEFVLRIAEKAVAATSAQTGDIEQKQVTLGEVQLALANAQERVRSIATFYTEGWRDFGMKYIKMLEAASDDIEPVTITKEGRLGRKMYQKEVSPKQWLTKSGYKVEVKLLDDKQAADVDRLQKLNATLQAMPTNVPLRTIYNRKLLEFADLTVEEMQQVEEFENQNQQQLLLGGGALQPGAQTQPGAPVPNQQQMVQ